MDPSCLIYAHVDINNDRTSYSIVDTRACKWLCRNTPVTTCKLIDRVRGRTSAVVAAIGDNNGSADLLDKIYLRNSQSLIPVGLSSAYAVVRIDAINEWEVRAAIKSLYGSELSYTGCTVVTLTDADRDSYVALDTSHPKRWRVALNLLRVRAGEGTVDEWPACIKSTKTGKVVRVNWRPKDVDLDLLVDEAIDGEAYATLRDTCCKLGEIDVEDPQELFQPFPVDEYCVYRCRHNSAYAAALLLNELRPVVCRERRRRSWPRNVDGGDTALQRRVGHDLAKYIVDNKMMINKANVPFIHVLLAACAKFYKTRQLQPRKRKWTERYQMDELEMRLIDDCTVLVKRGGYVNKWFDEQRDAFTDVKPARTFTIGGHQCVVHCRLGDPVRNVNASWLLGCETEETFTRKARQSAVPNMWTVRLIHELALGQGDWVNEACGTHLRYGSVETLCNGTGDSNVHTYLYQLHELIRGRRPLPASDMTNTTRDGDESTLVDERSRAVKYAECAAVADGAVTCRRWNKTQRDGGAARLFPTIDYTAVYLCRLPHKDVEAGTLERLRLWLHQPGLCV